MSVAYKKSIKQELHDLYEAEIIEVNTGENNRWQEGLCQV